jgi:hypothetical protein
MYFALWVRSSIDLELLSLTQYWFIGAAEDMAHSSLRFGIGRFTTEAEVDFVVEHLVRTVDRLREMRYVLLVLFKTL